MNYRSHFIRADEYITHLDGILTNDPEIQAKFAGVIAVIAAMAYEAAVRDIFVEFARIQNCVFGRFADHNFEHFRGGIKIDSIKGHLEYFGDEYKKDFIDSIAKGKESEAAASYNNLITWRNFFTHGGEISADATYKDGKKFYRQGQKIIDTLALVMGVYPDDVPTKSEC